MLYMYSVRWWYDGKPTTSSGVVYGTDAANATSRLVKELYEEVEEIHLYCVDEGDCGYIPLNVINEFAKDYKLEDESI